MNLPFIYYNIPAVPAYGVYISQLVRHSRTCGFYQDFMKECSCQQVNYRTKGSYWSSWIYYFVGFTVNTMTWLTVTEYLCHIELIYISFSFLLIIFWFVHSSMNFCVFVSFRITTLYLCQVLHSQWNNYNNQCSIIYLFIYLFIC